jgi:hypothetical protein
MGAPDGENSEMLPFPPGVVGSTPPQPKFPSQTKPRPSMVIPYPPPEKSSASDRRFRLPVAHVDQVVIHPRGDAQRERVAGDHAGAVATVVSSFMMTVEGKTGPRTATNCTPESTGALRKKCFLKSLWMT